MESTPRKESALTTKAAAELAGLTPSAFRTATTRLRATTGIDLRVPRTEWVDQRTPLWDAVAVREWAVTRPRK